MENNPKPTTNGDAPEKPINDELSKKMDDLLNDTGAEAPVEVAAEPVVEAPAEAAEIETPAEAPVEPAAVVEPEVKSTEPVIVAESTSAAPVAPAAPVKKKKSKKGLVIGIVAGLLVLGGGGTAAAYMILNTPENVALSAISNLLNTKDLTINGSFDLVPAEDAGMPFDSARITLNTSNDKDTQNSTTASLSVVMGEKSIDISLGTVVIKDYTMYFKLSGIKDAFNTAISALGIESSLGSYKTTLENTIGQIDDVWWKINIPELIDMMGTGSEATEAKKAYNCVVDVLDKAKAQDNKMADYYKKNAFVTLKKYEGGKQFSTKGTPYTMTINTEKLANFYNDVIDNATTDLGLSDCFKDISSVDVKTTTEKLNKEHFDKIFANFPDMVATIDGIFSHELTGIYLDKTDELYSGNLTLKFSKTSGSISAPSDSKSVVNLIQILTTAVSKLYSAPYSTNPSNLVDYPTSSLLRI